MALGTKYTRSIEIELGGESTKLQTALSEANRAIRSTKSEMGVLQKSLNLEWDSSKFQRAQELARKQVEQTQRKVEALEKALASRRRPSGPSSSWSPSTPCPWTGSRPRSPRCGSS